jgi:Ca2+-binding RTX toxin-like protein
MAKGDLDYDDLHDFFERPYEVTSQSETSWLFTATAGRYDGWSVEFIGSGLTGMDSFPDAGTIMQVIIKTPGGVVADDVDGLSLSAATLATQYDFGDHGHGGDDDLTGDDGDDHLHGRGGDDHLSGEGGDDGLKGQGGDDELHGGSGDDKLSGHGGKDKLFGDEGNDVLKGQGGNDKLEGGADDDILIGHGGKDVYIFGLDFGDDTIKRFDHGKDKINLKALGILDFETEVDIETANGDILVTTAEGTITIDKVTGGKVVDASDFLI